MEENQFILGLQVDQPASKNLSEVARWAKFLSIVGFVFMGLMVIFCFAMQAQLTDAFARFIPGFGSSQGFGILLVFIIVVAAVVFVLMYFLFRASILIRKGIETKNQETFNNGLASLKAYFTMYGILAILGVVTDLLNLNR